MIEFILSHEPAVRLGFFFGVFAWMALWEIRAPRRALTVPKTQRWTANLGIVVLDTVMLRLIFPAAAVGMALFARQYGWGVFNHRQAPEWLAVLASVIV